MPRRVGGLRLCEETTCIIRLAAPKPYLWAGGLQINRRLLALRGGGGGRRALSRVRALRVRALRGVLVHFRGT